MLVDGFMTYIQSAQSQSVADLFGAVLDSEAGLDLLLDHPDLADGSLTAANRLSGGLLVVSGLCLVGDHLTAVTAEAGACVIHSQFVLKPD